MSRPERSRPWLLPALMLVGAAGGLALGGVLGGRWEETRLEPFVLFIRLLGTVFLSILKALIVPLVVTSIITAITRMGDLRPVARTAVYTGFFFLSTTFAAVLTGIALVDLVRPGGHGLAPAAGAALAPSLPAGVSPIKAMVEIVSGLFPSNLAAAALEGNVLGLIVFSLMFGASVSLLGERRGPLVEVLELTNEALLKLVRVVVWLAPIGIFGLVADRIGKAGGSTAVWDEIQRLGWYAATVMVGLAFHAGVTLPLLLRVLGGRNPLRYAAGMGDSLLIALGTASSAATMPVTLRCAVERNGVSPRAADFVIPVGTTVNMDGTALYEAVAVIFIAQSLAIGLSISQQFVVALTATLAAIGAAAIPEAGLVTMLLVLNAVGLPAEGIGLLLSIDWVLDRFRTAVNVWGDSVAAAVVDRRLAASSGPS